MTKQNQQADEKTVVTYTVSIIEQRDRTKPFWHRIGVARAHEDAEGLTFHIPPGVTLSGEIVFRKRKPAEEQVEADA